MSYASAKNAGSETDQRVRISMSSADGPYDNQASVEFQVPHPDQTVERMLNKLADKFPNQSVVTIEKGSPAQLEMTQTQGGKVGMTTGVPVVSSGMSASMMNAGQASVTGSAGGTRYINGNQVQTSSHFVEMPTTQSSAIYNSGAGYTGGAAFTSGAGYTGASAQQYTSGYNANYTGAAQVTTSGYSHSGSVTHQSRAPEVRVDPVTGKTYHITWEEQRCSRFEVQVEKKVVPRFEVQYVEKIVEVPEVVEIERKIEVPDVKLVEKITEINYVEVPVIEERIVHVPRKEYVEVVKTVPRVDVQYVEKIQEIEQIQWVDQMVEQEQYQEVVKYVPKVVVQNVPVEVVKTVPKIVVNKVERVVEVPGQVIENRVTRYVDETYQVPNPRDITVPCVVNQKLMWYVGDEVSEEVDVEVKQYVPHLVPVEVYIPRPVELPYVLAGKSYCEHEVTKVSAAHWNGLVYQLNANFDQAWVSMLPLMKDVDGSSPVQSQVNVVRPSVSESEIKLYREYAMHLVEAHAVDKNKIMMMAQQQSSRFIQGQQAYQTSYQQGGSFSYQPQYRA